jgi:hypothetical protein
MRSILFPAIAAALTAAVMAVPAEAATTHRHHHASSGPSAAAPVYQQAPSGSYFGGTDPDAGIREEMLRDPPNDR